MLHFKVEGSTIMFRRFADLHKLLQVEEGLYEDFVCWGKSIINQKTESNARVREFGKTVSRLDSQADLRSTSAPAQ